MSKQPVKTKMPQKYMEAMRLYIKDGLTAKQISEQLHVQENTLGRWVNRGNWREQRQKAIAKTLEQRKPTGADAIVLFDFIEHLRSADPELAYLMRHYVINYLKQVS